MELKAATDQEIQDEIARRVMVKKNSEIRSVVETVNVLYNTGKILTAKVTHVVSRSDAEKEPIDAILITYKK